jgi:hypothetical protein
MGFKNHIRHMAAVVGNTLLKTFPEVWWVLKMVELNLPNETCPTSLPPLQPEQCPIEMWEIFLPHPVEYQNKHYSINQKDEGT